MLWHEDEVGKEIDIHRRQREKGLEGGNWTMIHKPGWVHEDGKS